MVIQQVSFQECNTHFSSIFERVSKNHEVISVQKEPEQAVVILDAQEYNSLVETLHLLSNPANAERLREGISQHKQDSARSEKQPSSHDEKGIENLFGMVKADRGVSLDDMEAAIRRQGSRM
jgi:antitoxin YefM